MAYKQSPGRMNMPKTGRGLDAPTLMKGSPAKAAFPIKEKTKLGKDEKATVTIQGVETVFSDLSKAKASLSKFRKSNPNAPAGDRGEITGVTDLGGGKLTEQRKSDPAGKGKRSKRLTSDEQPVTASFSLKKDDKSGNVARIYN